MTRAQYWWRLAKWPLAIAAITLAAIGYADLDLRFARSTFYRGEPGWIGAHSWIANELLHDGGRWLVRLAGLAALSLWLSSFGSRRLREYRRPASYLLLAAGFSVGIIGTLKATTNVDCPWDLIELGGTRPYVRILDSRPEGLPHAQCFPAAHAGSAFAWMALYFALRGRSLKWAQRSLCVSIALGAVFGVAQQSRGAHFISHDLVSATISWITALTIYTYAFGARLWTDSRRQLAHSHTRAPHENHAGRFSADRRRRELEWTSDRPRDRPAGHSGT